MAKVSIIMPACNVQSFLKECMDSVVSQTLEDIEIICVDDGSTDSTGEILDQYANEDQRVKVIHKVNTGYGNSMNVGLDAASGEYIGIVETDDFVDRDMFEKLYDTAKNYDADVVKSNYYTYVSNPKPQSTFFEVLEPFQNYDAVFCPLDVQDVFRVRPCIWTGLYRRAMLEENKVRFNETPGASYQDTAFAFKVWTSAERAVLVKDAYLHYRTDNANSSVKSAAKIFCLCDEYREMERFLDRFPEKKAKLETLKNYLKYESYRWNYERLSLEYKYCFLLKMKEELLAAREQGKLDRSLFQDFQWAKLTKILDDTDGFFKETCRKEQKKTGPGDMSKENKRLKKENRRLKKENTQLENDNKHLRDRIRGIETSASYKIGRKVTFVPGKIKKKLKGSDR